jgi:hypothetical protein
MSEIRPDSVPTPVSSSVPVPDFAPIVLERRSPVVLILSVISALAAAALFFLAKGGS